MVLVVSPAGLFTGLSGDWPVCYELCSVSALDEPDGADRSLMLERLANMASHSMCQECDMEQPTHDDIWLESVVFTSIF